MKPTERRERVTGTVMANLPLRSPSLARADTQEEIDRSFEGTPEYDLPASALDPTSLLFLDCLLPFLSS